MNIKRELTKEERKYLVLGHIVHEYVSSAVPISSKMVVERMGGGISSATIRNIMAELEDEFYIAQPYTSAGRIPTQFGYRRYVDMLKARVTSEKREAKRLALEYDRRIRTIREVIHKTSSLISSELHNAGIAMWPSVGSFYLKHMELVKIKAETIMAVLVTMTNDVKNYVVKLDSNVDKADLEKVANYLNSNYEASAVSSIYEDLRRQMGQPQGETSGEIMKMAQVSLKVIDALIEEDIENEVYWEGLDYMMNEAEGQDINVMRRIVRIFSDRKDLVKLLKKDLPHEGVRVHIGTENSYEEMKDCSIVTCGYKMQGRTVGRIGVVGPMRMDYDNAMWTVSCISDLISRKLRELTG